MLAKHVCETLLTLSTKNQNQVMIATKIIDLICTVCVDLTLLPTTDLLRLLFSMVYIASHLKSVSNIQLNEDTKTPQQTQNRVFVISVT